MINFPWLGSVILLGNFVPGYLLTALWDKKWADNLTLGECLFVQLLLGVVLNSGLMLLLAELEIFKLSIVLLSWGIICGFSAWIGRRHLRRGLSWPKPSQQELALVALLLLAGILFAHPAEAMLCFDDSGIYFLGGVQLAKTGSLVTRDPVMASLSPEQGKQLLFTGPWSNVWSRYWGQFFIWSWPNPWIVFGLLHLQRLWCGLFTLFLGTYGGLWVAPAFGLLALAGLYFFGHRLFDQKVGMLAATFLMLNFAQIWHVRLPLSEALTQALVIGGFYLVTVFLEKRLAWLGFWAGVCLGTLFLARIDALVIEVLFIGLFLYWKCSEGWHPEYTGFALALLAVVVFAALHNGLVGWAYLTMLWQMAGSPQLAKAAILGSLGGGLVALVAWLRPKLTRIFLDWFSIHIWRIYAAGFSIWLLWVVLSRLFSGNAWASQVVTWLVWYWTPLGILLAAIGLGLLLVRQPERKMLPVLAVGLIYMGAFSLHPMVNPVHPWAMRRFMPTVMPLIALLIAYGIITMPIQYKVLRYTVQVVVISALIWALLRMDQPLLRRTEYSGVGQQIAQLAERFERDALVLFDKGAPSLYIPQPLAYLYDVCSFVLQESSPSSVALDPLLESWRQQGHSIYLVVTGGDLEWHPNRWAFQASGVFDLQFTRLKRSPDNLPTNFEDSLFRLDIYQIVPSPEKSSDQKTTYLLNMEAGEYPYLRGGFHGLEIAADGLTYRWTDGSARVQIPGQANSDALLRLRVAGGRPTQEVLMTVAVNGVIVAKESLPPGFAFQTLEITVPSFVLSSSSQEAIIEILSDTWIPQEAGYQEDTRELGVLVDWIEWSPQRGH